MGKQIIVEEGSEGKEREEALYFPKLNNYMKITVAFGLGYSAVSYSVGYHGAFTDFSIRYLWPLCLPKPWRPILIPKDLTSLPREPLCSPTIKKAQILAFYSIFKNATFSKKKKREWHFAVESKKHSLIKRIIKIWKKHVSRTFLSAYNQIIYPRVPE